MGALAPRSGLLRAAGTPHLRATQRRCLSLRRNWVGNREQPVETSPDKLRAIAEDVKSEARKLGLPLVGITSPRASARFDKYKQWLQNGYHGELDYMERDDRVARRGDPQLVMPGAAAVIMVGMPYWPGKTGFPSSHSVSAPNPRQQPSAPGTERDDAEKEEPAARGIVSCYAWGTDYHTLLSKRLRKLAQALNQRAGGVGRFYVDTGAVLERDFAERAGLGFIGKNSLLIDPRLGSGFFIGELFTTVPLPVDDRDAAAPAEAAAGDAEEGADAASGAKRRRRRRRQPGCGKCTRCMDACPTDAIVADRVVDARRCISYLTIELKGSIPLGLRRGMGARVYGCDICQVVCPWNRLQWDAAERGSGDGGYSPLFGTVGEAVAAPVLGELLAADEEGFQRRFKGTAVKRIGRERMARNAAVGLGNVGGEQELDVVRRAAQSDESELVREHALWAVGEIERRLNGTAAGRDGKGR